jgi:hypothetical protein
MFFSFSHGVLTFSCILILDLVSGQPISSYNPSYFTYPPTYYYNYNYDYYNYQYYATQYPTSSVPAVASNESKITPTSKEEEDKNNKEEAPFPGEWQTVDVSETYSKYYRPASPEPEQKEEDNESYEPKTKKGRQRECRIYLHHYHSHHVLVLVLFCFVLFCFVEEKTLLRRENTMTVLTKVRLTSRAQNKQLNPQNTNVQMKAIQRTKRNPLQRLKTRKKKRTETKTITRTRTRQSRMIKTRNQLCGRNDNQILQDANSADSYNVKQTQCMLYF